MKNIHLAYLLLLSFALPAHADEIRVVATKITGAVGPQSSSGKAHSMVRLTVSNEEELNALKQSGEYAHVEIDYPVSIPTPGFRAVSLVAPTASPAHSEVTPNNPKFSEQWYYQKASDFRYGAADFITSWINHPNKRKVRVAVMDTDFILHDEVEYAEGYSFVKAFGETRNPNYYYAQEDEPSCSIAHGLGVASIIGTGIDDGVGTAGLANVDIVAGRVMDCGFGYMSDTADAILWASGETVEGVPDISQPVDVINLSLAGKTTSCPFYLQQALNKVAEKGILVVTAAGNEAEDAMNYSPANCEHVFTVGAVDRLGQKTDFSNFGPKVDLMAPGYNIISPVVGGYGYWDGTSQAAPMVTGAVAHAIALYPDITMHELRLMLTQTAQAPAEDVDSLANSCEGDMCGAGLLRVGDFMALAEQHMSGAGTTIEHVLYGRGGCHDAVVVQYLGGTAEMCDSYVINFEGALKKFGSNSREVTYELYQVRNEDPFSLGEAERVLSTTEVEVIAKDIDASGYRFGYRTCVEGVCDEHLFRTNMERATLPEECQ